MADQDRFRFSLDDEEPEIPYRDEGLERSVKRLGARVSFLTLMLPCLLAIALYAAFRELDLRVDQGRSSEIKTAELFAGELEQATAGLNARIERLEAGLNSRVEGLEAALNLRLEATQKSGQALQEEAKRGEAALERLSTLAAAKADKKELTESLARVDAALAAVAKDLQALAPFREELGSAATQRKELSALASRLQSLENSLGKDLTGLAGFLDKTKADLTKIRAEIAGLEKRTLDREEVALEILKAKKLQQLAMDNEKTRVDKSLSTLERRMDQVERAFSAPPANRPPALPPLPGRPSGIREQPLE
jgi:chromosome segregation ATPase